MTRTAQLKNLIPERGAREVIRDEIAAILVCERDNQIMLSGPNGPFGAYDLRVFTERSNPIEALGRGDEDRSPPVVNIWAETSTADMSQSVPVNRTRFSTTIHLDCYGCATSEEMTTGDGHTTGDENAVREAERAKQIVCGILMSGQYALLGFPDTKTGPSKQLVFGRKITSVQAFQPSYGDRPAEHVAAIRIDLEVLHDETWEQFAPLDLDLIQITMNRSEDGEWFQSTITP